MASDYRKRPPRTFIYHKGYETHTQPNLALHLLGGAPRSPHRGFRSPRGGRDALASHTLWAHPHARAVRRADGSRACGAQGTAGRIARPVCGSGRGRPRGGHGRRRWGGRVRPVRRAAPPARRAVRGAMVGRGAHLGGRRCERRARLCPPPPRRALPPRRVRGAGGLRGRPFRRGLPAHAVGGGGGVGSARARRPRGHGRRGAFLPARARRKRRAQRPGRPPLPHAWRRGAAASCSRRRAPASWVATVGAP